MKKLKLLAIFALVLTALLSCSRDEEQPLFEEGSNSKENNESALNVYVLSLNEIKEPQLSEQLNKSESYVKDFVSKYDHLLLNHSIDNLEFDTEHIFVNNETGSHSYSVFMTIPHLEADTPLPGVLTLDFESGINTLSHLEFGFQLENRTTFDSHGKVPEASIEKSYYSSKPWNKRSKAPKGVVCNYNARRSSPIPELSYYCGQYGGSYVPVPQRILDVFLTQHLTHNTDDFYVKTYNYYYGIVLQSFNSYNGILRDEIYRFYHSTSPYQGPYYTPGNRTESYHLNKQAFVDSFFDYLNRMRQQRVGTYNFLMGNQDLLHEVFNVFSYYNLSGQSDEGIYLEVPYGIYSANSKIKCLSKISNYLLTDNGAMLLSYYNNGYYSSSLRTILNDNQCN